MRLLAISLASLVWVPFVPSAIAGTVDELRSAQQRFVELFNRHDAAGLAGLLHRNYTEFTLTGDVPEDWTGRSLQQRRDYFRDFFQEYETCTVDLEGARYWVSGSTGIVAATQKLTQKPRNGVLGYPRTRVTFTWIAESGGWQLLSAHHSSPPATGPGAPPLAQDAAETRILHTVMEQPRWAGVPLPDGRLLRVLAESIEARNVVELGTSTGFSALWLADALRKTGGRLTTFEIDRGRAAIAREQFRLAGVESLVTLVEGDAHEGVRRLKGPIDMVFIDADKNGYPDYLRVLLPLVRAGGLIVAHNMRFPSPNPEYVRAVTTDPNLETVFVNMDDQGVGITLKKR
jgi:predicted O-methyltransferase YrrM